MKILRFRFVFFLSAMLLFHFNVSFAAKPLKAWEPSVAVLGDKGIDTPSHGIEQWLFLGPLPAMDANALQVDCLESLGGAEKAALEERKIISWGEGASFGCAQCFRYDAVKDGIADITDIYRPPKQVSYCAFTWLDSKNDETVYAAIDTPGIFQIWLNGTKLLDDPQVDFVGWQSQFPLLQLSLKKGPNRLLIRFNTSRSKGNVSFITVPQDKVEELKADFEKKAQTRAFQNLALRIKWNDGGVKYSTIGPELPAMGWDGNNSFRLLKNVRVQWFDNNLNPVTQIDKPGRYAYYVEADRPGGGKYRQASTVLSLPPNYQDWGSTLTMQMPRIADLKIATEIWDSWQKQIDPLARDIFLGSVWENSGMAANMAALYEAHPIAGTSTNGTNLSPK